MLSLALAAHGVAQKIDDRIVFSPKTNSGSWHSQANAAAASTIQGHTYGDPPFLVHAKSNSPGAITYALVSGNANVESSGLVTLTGTGSVTIEALQAAKGIYGSATATADFSVSPGTPRIRFDLPIISNNAPFALSASSDSTGAFTYSVISGPAQIAGNMVSLTGTGQVVLEASEAADSNYNAGSKTLAFTVGTSTLTIMANNASRLYGAPNPSFTGSITGANHSDNFVETFTTAATLMSAPGMYALVPGASGSSLSTYTVNTVDGTLTIAQAPTLTTLTTDGTTITPGQPLSLTARVTSTTTGVPTGSVTFLDNGTALQTVPMVNGTASLTTSLSASTTHLLTASSSGDTDFLPSALASPLSIAAGPQDFAFTIQGAPTDMSAPGKMATFSFGVTPLSGTLGAPVTFTVQGLPNGASATFTPSTLAADAGPAAIQLHIKTSVQTSRLHELPASPAGQGIAIASLVFLAFTNSSKLRRRLGGRLLAVLLIGFALSGTVLLTGCGSGVFQEVPGSYSLSVVATSGSLQHTQKVTLQMQ